MMPKVTGQVTKCEVGHFTHEVLHIDLQLLDEHHGLKDAPKIKPEWAMKLPFNVFNYKLYANTKGYCPADDEVSRSIYSHGVWEGFETILFLDILHQGNKDNLVLDFGSNIGWYSVIAAKLGYNVHAFDSDTQINELHSLNALENAVAKKITLDNRWIGVGSDKVEVDSEVEFLKCDIEGSEEHMYSMTKHLFETNRIKYALLEISPVFNDSYFELVPKIIANGYTAYRIPTKGTELMEIYEQEPLQVIKDNMKIETSDWTEYIKSFSQDNFLFIRNDLCSIHQ